jgi:hypothetical protein
MQSDSKTDQCETPPCQRSGNRCGHDPRSPRWFQPPPEHGERPTIIVKWIERAKQFYDNPGRIPSLANALFGRKVAADPEGDHKPRKMRSERREACCDLLGSIAHYCDLPSLCLSVPQPDGSLLPITMELLADRAGLGLRRAERAMRDIVSGGLIGVHPRAEPQPDGTYIGRAAIRVVPPSFFGLFGLEERLEHDRRRISQKRIEARGGATPTRTAGARIRTAVGAALGKITGRGTKPTAPAPAAAQIPEPAAPQLPELPELPDYPHAGHIRDMKAILAGTTPRRGEDGHSHQHADQAAAEPTAAPAGDHPARGSRRGTSDPQGP